MIAGAGGGAIAGGATGAGHAAVVVAISGGTTAAPASVYVVGWAVFGAVTGGIGGAAAGC